MHNYGEDETPSADMATDKPIDPKAYSWTTYAERLQAAGIRWKVYQEYDNFGDNLLSVFPPFRPCEKESELYRRGRAWVSEHVEGPDRTRSDGEQLVAAFRRDIESGQLPQISWIVTAADLSEHPKAEPSKGEHVTAKLVEALIDNPEVFAKTVFILNYDEAGGFYDHMAPPVPPVGDYHGKSTVPLDGETKDYRGTGEAGDERHPIGLGIRTPTIVVSPWSRGGQVCSELFDHTSVLQFMEKRFGVREPNISPWRRSVCGDLTSVFDFSNAEGMSGQKLPGTDDFRERVSRSAAGTANDIPARQSPTTQMSGQRTHRPAPYRIVADSRIDAEGRIVIAMINAGKAGVAMTVHDNRDRAEPRHYTIGAGARIDDIWEADGDMFDLTLHGPNGFWRRFAGSTGTGGNRQVRLIDRPELDAVELQLENRSAAPLSFTIALDDAYPAYAAPRHEVIVAPGKTVTDLWRLSKSDNWYDLSVTTGSKDGALWRYAGKVENGRPGRTDPAIGVMRV
jgi:phospholipase C